MKSYPLILTLLATLMAGCQSSNDQTTRPELVPAGSFVKAWTTNVGLSQVKAFYFVNDLLFVYGPENDVVAFDTAGGLVFRTHVGAPEDELDEPMVQADRVIFPTSSSLEIISRQGVHLKSIVLDQPIRSPGVVVDQTVYAGVDSEQGGRIAAIALDRENYYFRWTRLAQGVVHTKPALYENVLYFATESGQVVALTPDPILLWPRTREMPDSIFKSDGKIYTAITVDDGGVYVPSTDTKLYALDPTTGKIRWEYFTGAPVNNSATPTTDTVYLRVEGKGLVALDKKSATRYAQPRWANPSAVKVLSDDAKLVYVLTESGSIAALDKKTGAQQFVTQRSDFVRTVTHINPRDNTLFALTSDNQLIAVKPVTRSGVVGELVLGEPANTQTVIAMR